MKGYDQCLVHLLLILLEYIFQIFDFIKAKNITIRNLNQQPGTLTLSTMRTLSLRKLEVYLPEIHEYLTNIKPEAKAKSHKEVGITSFVAKFKSDCQKTCSKIVRNPFTDQLFRKVNSLFIFPASICDSADNVLDLGETQ